MARHIMYHVSSSVIALAEKMKQARLTRNGRDPTKGDIALSKVSLKDRRHGQAGLERGYEVLLL